MKRVVEGRRGLCWGKNETRGAGEAVLSGIPALYRVCLLTGRGLERRSGGHRRRGIPKFSARDPRDTGMGASPAPLLATFGHRIKKARETFRGGFRVGTMRSPRCDPGYSITIINRLVTSRR
jgi:hypothetical protein